MSMSSHRLWPARRAHLATTTTSADDSLSQLRRSGERVRERGFQKSATSRWNEPLSPSLSPLVPRGERGRVPSAMVGISRCAPARLCFLFLLLLRPGGAMHGSDMNWNIAPGGRWRELTVRPNGKTGFTSLPPEQTGITFTNLLKERTGAANRVLQDGSGVAVGDLDGNGTLDLYVANNRTDDIRDRGELDLKMVNGKLAVPPQYKDRLVIVDGKLLEYGEPDILYLNDGHGRFSAVSWTDGTFLDEQGNKLSGPPLDWGLSVTFRDMNGDGFPDIYVCNDYWTPDRIWINDGKGHFRAIEKLALRTTSASSMGVDFADIGRTGNLDFFVVDMLSRDLRLRKRQMFAQKPAPSPIGAIDNRPQIMRNTLFLNRGDGTYAEMAN